MDINEARAILDGCMGTDDPVTRLSLCGYRLHAAISAIGTDQAIEAVVNEVLRGSGFKLVTAGRDGGG